MRSEEVTGGRLGGILAIGAVQAALEYGLESDPSSMADGTTSPVIRDGRLDLGAVGGGARVTATGTALPTAGGERPEDGKQEHEGETSHDGLRRGARRRRASLAAHELT